MSKLTFLAAGFLSIVFTLVQLASFFGINTIPVAFASHEPSHIEITRPQVDGRNVGFSTIGDFIQKITVIAFVIAIIVVLFMLIWGAFEWITSGGDKDNVGKARGRIINALIGMAVLAIAFALFRLAGSFLGFDISNFNIPTPAP